MAKLTPEERKARARQREDDRRKMAEAFPGASLVNEEVQLRLEAGDDFRLIVRRKPDSVWRKDEYGWEETWVMLRAESLVRFIAALTARYNDEVQRMNESAAKTGTVKVISAST